MSAWRSQPPPDREGWIILIDDGVLWARYNPRTREIHMRRGRKEGRFRLSDYDPQEPKP